MKFTERLIKSRNEKGWTQAEISNLLNIKRSTYAKYEVGENQPDFQTLIKLANLFGKSTDYLLGRVSDKESIDVDTGPFLPLKNKLEESNIDPKSLLNSYAFQYLNTDDLPEIKLHIEWVMDKAANRYDNKKNYYPQK